MAETVKKLSVKFEGDTTGLNTAVKRATESFADVDKAVKSLQKQFDEFGSGTSLTKQTEALKTFEVGVTTCKSTLGKLYNIKKQLEDQDKSGQGLYKATKQYQDLETKIAYVTQRQKEFQESYERLSKENQNAVKIASTYESIAQQIESSNEKLSQTQSFIDVINKALESSPGNFALLNLQAKQFDEQLATCSKNTNSLKSYIADLRKNGVDTLSKEFIEVNNALNDSKAKYQELKNKTLEYYDALNKASKLSSDIASRGNALKQALEIDPTNTKLLASYHRVLSQEIKESEKNEKAFEEAIASLPTKSIENVSKEYAELASGLTNAKKRTAELKQEYQRANETVANYNANMKKVKETLSTTSKTASVLQKALELDPTNTQKQAQYTEFLKQAIEKCKEQQELLNQEIKNLDASNADVLKGKYTELTENLNNVVSQQREYEEALRDTTGAANSNAGATDQNVVKTADFNTALTTLHSTLNSVSNKLDSLTDSLLDNAMSYESNVASIKKVVTDLTDDTVDSLKEIAIQSGNTFDSIAEYATLGATLGIAQDALDDFTDAMVKLEAASDGSISGEEGAKAVARLLNQFDIGAEYAENFGSAVTYVGDQFAATANEILDTASYMGGLSAINNVTINDLIGLASEMKNLGIETASGASAVSKTFLTIENQVQTAGDNLEEFASTAGMTAEEFSKVWKSAPTDAFLSFVNGLSTKVFDEINESIENGSGSLDEYANALNTTTDAFKKMWKQDPTGTFEKYKDALGDMEEGSQSASVTLNHLSLSGVRVAQTLLKLAGNGDVVRDAIEDSSKAWKENTNLTKKANTVYETTEKKLESAKEAIRQAAASLGDTFLPLVKDAADVVTSLTKTFNALPKSAKVAIAGTTLLATGLTKVGSSALGALSWLNQMSLGNSELSKTCLKLLNNLTGGSGGLVATLSTALPMALGLAGAAAVAYAGYFAVTNDETYKFNQQMKELSEKASVQYVESLKTINTNMVDINKAYEDLTYSASMLKLNPDDTIDTTSESYKDLQEKITTLNSYMGTEFITGIDSVTQQFVNQKGEVVDVQKELKNYRTELERDAWLKANQDSYNESLNVTKDKLSELVSKQSEINDAKRKFLEDNKYFSEDDLQLYEDITNGVKELSDLSQDAKEKYYEISDAVKTSSILSSLYQEYNAIDGIYQRALNTVNQYNSIDTAPVEEVAELINSITGEEKEIVIDYNADSIDSCKEAINKINVMLETCQQMADEYDTTEMQKQLENLKLQALDDLSAAIGKQKEFDSSIENTATTYQASADSIGESVDEVKGKQDEVIQGQGNIDDSVNTTTDNIATKYLGANSIWDKVAEIAALMGGDISGIFKTISDNSGSTSTNIGNNFDKAFNNINTNVGKTTTSSSKSFNDALANILGNTKTTFNSTEGIKNIINNSTTSTAETISKTYLGNNGLWSSFAASCKGAVEKVKTYFDSLKNYGEINQTVRITTIHDDVYVSSYKASGKSYSSGGGRSGGFNTGFTSLVPDLTIPKLSSGGHGAMTLKASFTINNNGDNITQSMSQKIGKQIVNYINEELGKGI